MTATGWIELGVNVAVGALVAFCMSLWFQRSQYMRGYKKGEESMRASRDQWKELAGEAIAECTSLVKHMADRDGVSLPQELEELYAAQIAKKPNSPCEGKGQTGSGEGPQG